MQRNNIKDNIYLVGPMGAGKSTIGKKIAEILDWDFYDTDREVEERTGVPLTWLYDLEGVAGVQKREMAILTELSKGCRAVIATGGETVLAEANRKILASSNYVVYLKLDLNTQYERTQNGTIRHQLVNEDNVKVVLEKAYSKLSPLYEAVSTLSFNTHTNCIKKLAENIIQECELLVNS